ncbi:MAG TPA: ASCH domain-containing protein [Patescibacteria group bacterium]|nr:ASCH domain-containing protein [Patescibacteria group bacterium]
MTDLLPAIALSIRQPWCHRILYDGKDVENRSWPTRFRGRVLIHASKGVDAGSRDEIRAGAMPLGGIVGVMEITDCVSAMDSEWFFGRYGFVIRNAQPLPFMPCKGSLGFFRVDLPPLIARACRTEALSEGQGSKMLGLDRISFRDLCDAITE